MRHNHVTVTVETDTVARIEDRLEPGETVAHWMREAVERRLAADADDASGSSDATGSSDAGRSGDAGGPGDGRRSGGADGSGDADGSGTSGGSDRRDPDREGPVYEFVDDCAI